jgi:hypothetical protein
VTRPGSPTILLFPVIETGEVDGFVLVGGTDGTQGRPGAALRVILRDLAGQVVAETTSAFDGFFFLDRIPYGRYRLSLDPQQLDELRYAAGPPREVSIGAEEPFAVGQDLYAPAAPALTAAARSTTAQTN